MVQHHNVVVSNFIFIKVGSNWHYVCVLVDLFNREIIGEV